MINPPFVTTSVKQQKNGVDCGLFSPAFATTLAFGGDPSTATYDAAYWEPIKLSASKIN